MAGLVLVGSLFLTGCASLPMASQSADATAKRFAVPTDKANLYIYRNETFGAALKMPVTIDGSAVGSTAFKTYIYRQVEPGNHVVNFQGKSSLSVDAEAGKNYFIWQEVKMGLVSGGSELQLVNESRGKTAVRECELVQ